MNIDYISIIVIVTSVIISIAITILIIIPILKKTCVIGKDNCENITYQLNSNNGEILLKTQDGYTYWLTKDYIYAYGDYTGISCPNIYTDNQHAKSCQLKSGDKCLCYNLECNVFGVCKCNDYKYNCDKEYPDGTCECYSLDPNTNKCTDPTCSNSNIDSLHQKYISDFNNLNCESDEQKTGYFLVSPKQCYENDNSNPIYKTQCLSNDNAKELWKNIQTIKENNLLYDFNGKILSLYSPSEYKGNIIDYGYNYSPAFVVDKHTFQLVPGQVRCVQNLDHLEKSFENIQSFKLNVYSTQDETLDIYQIIKILQEKGIYK